jgi:hypothetical protein
MTFNFNENKISFEDNVKLLRVTIDSNSNFNNHISEINKKKPQCIYIASVNIL